MEVNLFGEIEKKTQTLSCKINSAIRILRIAEKQASEYNEPVEIAYSGGKDSDVLLQLAKESGINFRAIYKNTTIDPKGTLFHVKQNNVEIRQPQRSFFRLIQAKGFPSMFRRFCCAELKEYKILNVCAVGVRADESVKRSKKYTTFENSRVFSKKERVHQYAPIYNWTLQDVKDFIISRGIELAPYYYEEDGKISFKKRLGCVGCPLKSDRGVNDFKKNIPILKAWLRSGVIYTHAHALKKFNNNAVDAFYCNVFCRSYEEYLQKRNNLFGEKFDAKKEIEKFFNVTFNF